MSYKAMIPGDTAGVGDVVITITDGGIKTEGGKMYATITDGTMAPPLPSTGEMAMGKVNSGERRLPRIYQIGLLERLLVSMYRIGL